MTVPPPATRLAVRSDGVRLGLYASVDGKVRLAKRWAANGPDDGLYPLRMIRMEKTADVVVRCGAPAHCAVIRPAGMEEFSAPAVTFATRLAVARARYPFDATVSFRLFSTLPQIVDWAPQLCPSPIFSKGDNRHLQHELDLIGACFPVQPEDAAALPANPSGR